MANMLNDIPELLRQIRQVENEHNRLVDEYFQISRIEKQKKKNCHSCMLNEYFNFHILFRR